ncbi:MAG: isoprenylcysteine carboxylmethyltransferase family protein [Planctomycetes bacterium]|nr:isoprenylcysteine carboxylmethyltransferase family protein [Planctomycetota bacterium]
MEHVEVRGTARRARALAWGIATHGAFAVAVGAMAFALHAGLHVFPRRTGLGLAIAADFALLLQFPLLHSLLLTRGARPEWLRRALLGAQGDPLATTRFVLVSALQLLLVFLAWQPLAPWSARLPDGALLVLNEVLFAASWGLLVWAMHTAGMAVQSGSLGWTSLWRDETPRFPRFEPRGLYRVTRHPIYVAFTLVLWTAPTWTLDRVLLASVWTLYGILGARRKEARLLARHGDPYREYAARTPFWIPLPFARSWFEPSIGLERAAAPRMLSAREPQGSSGGRCASSS